MKCVSFLWTEDRDHTHRLSNPLVDRFSIFSVCCVDLEASLSDCRFDLIHGRPRSASTIAESECTFLVLDHKTFDRLTEDSPEIL
ncbi:MAG: hypothetical protein ACH350_05195 [Parachlamydiaceae bacterium]